MLAACCVRCDGCSLCLSAFRLPFFHALLRGSFFPTNPRTQPPTVQHKNRGSQNQIKILVINLGKAICHIDTGTSILPFSLVDLYRFTLLWNNSHIFGIQFHYLCCTIVKSADTSHANFKTSSQQNILSMHPKTTAFIHHYAHTQALPAPKSILHTTLQNCFFGGNNYVSIFLRMFLAYIFNKYLDLYDLSLISEAFSEQIF